MSDASYDVQIYDLLAARATEGLSDEALRDLTERVHPVAGLTLDTLDVAAAAADCYYQQEVGVEPLPGDLRGRVLEQARRWAPAGSIAVAEGGSGGDEMMDTDASEPIGRIESSPPASTRLRHPDRVDFRRDGVGGQETLAQSSFALGDGGSGLPWLLAAASFLLAVIGWLRPALGPDFEADSAPTLAEVQAAPDTIEASWLAQEDPAAENASGRVVWSDALQAGYMVFDGLAALDPSEQVYQLWIFDPRRPDETPVDGGVFSIPDGQTRVEVPINAKLSVQDPNMFAVTIEDPGGVVVSSRERLPLLAKPSEASSG